LGPFGKKALAAMITAAADQPGLSVWGQGPGKKSFFNRDLLFYFLIHGFFLRI
jgi:hypothetical protein